jgi:hypothetical protein
MSNSAHDDYAAQGYALAPGIIPPEVARAMLKRLHTDLERSGTPVSRLGRSSAILQREAYELSGAQYPPIATFLWGLTPGMSEITGVDLLPTYAYFRLYRKGDVCFVHEDRPACEHSLSLTLDYSDGIRWPLEIASGASKSTDRIQHDFGATPYRSLAMEPGDGVAYRGTEHRHGRTTPNPNGWSAHLFLHWIDPNGPHAAEAFDKLPGMTDRVEFRFG